MDTRTLPLQVLRESTQLRRQLNKLINNEERLRENKHYSHNDVLITIEENSENPKFYFCIFHGQVYNGNTVLFPVEMTPKGVFSNEKSNATISTNQIIVTFKNWHLRIKEHLNTPLFEDEDFSQYVEKFYTDFKILDDDANTEKFDFEQQTFLNEYLDFIEKKLVENSDKYEVKEIQDDVKLLKKNLSRLPKNKVIKSLSRILAKIWGEGLDVLNEVYSQSKKEIIKKVTSLGVEGVKQISEMVIELISP